MQVEAAGQQRDTEKQRLLQMLGAWELSGLKERFVGLGGAGRRGWHVNQLSIWMAWTHFCVSHVWE